MRYRTKFRLSGHVYYTEWFDTFDEAFGFAQDANDAGTDVFPLVIEDEEGNAQ